MEAIGIRINAIHVENLDILPKIALKVVVCQQINKAIMEEKAGKLMIEVEEVEEAGVDLEALAVEEEDLIALEVKKVALLKVDGMIHKIKIKDLKMILIVITKSSQYGVVELQIVLGEIITIMILNVSMIIKKIEEEVTKTKEKKEVLINM